MAALVPAGLYHDTSWGRAGDARTSIRAHFQCSPHLLLDGTWPSQTLELFSQVASGTNIIFQQDGYCQKQAQKCPF